MKPSDDVLPLLKCLSCKHLIHPKRLAAVPNARYCVSCQAERDKYGMPPKTAMAVLSEPDDVTRIREEGWLNG